MRVTFFNVAVTGDRGKTKQKMKEEIANNAEKLIAEGKLIEAVDFLGARTLKNDEIQKELSLLNSRIHNLKKQERLGLITDIDSRVEINRITHSFLSILYDFKGESKKITNESVLIDRAKLLREEQVLIESVEKFKSDYSSIFRVEELVKKLFNDFPMKFEEFADDTGLNIIYLQSDKNEFDSILNFEVKGSIYLKWNRRYSNSLSEAVLTFMLYDRPQTFSRRVSFKEYEPRQLKRVAFKPTINKHSAICWENEKYSFLLTDELFNIIFELILIRLE